MNAVPLIQDVFIMCFRNNKTVIIKNFWPLSGRVFTAELLTRDYIPVASIW